MEALLKARGKWISPPTKEDIDNVFAGYNGKIAGPTLQPKDYEYEIPFNSRN